MPPLSTAHPRRPAQQVSYLPPRLSCKSCVCESLLLKIYAVRGLHGQRSSPERSSLTHHRGASPPCLSPRLCFPQRLFHSLAIHRDAPARYTPSPVDCLAPTRPLTFTASSPKRHGQ